MQQRKQVILWKPKRAGKLSPQGKPMPGEYVGKFATRVPEGTPGAIRNVGSNDAGRKWDFWETHVDSVAGNLRWIDKRDGGEYGTTLEVFLESNQFLHQISFKYDGFVLKEDIYDQLQFAIQTVLKGGKSYSPRITENLAKEKSDKGDLASEILTRREREILRLAALGKSNRDIGDELDISVRTVESHRSNLMRKLDLQNVQELVAFAVKQGIVSVDEIES